LSGDGGAAMDASAPRPAAARLGQALAPGLALSLAVAVAAYLIEAAMRAHGGGRLALPAMVVALILGALLNGLANRAAFQPGMAWCVKTLLRYAVGLLGLRVALGDIVALGMGVALLVIAAMIATVASGFWLARLLGRSLAFGALAGAATAVCGASATLATATVAPDYREKAADIANAVSTLVMIAYPPLCAWLGLSPHETGVMLGATIHDMAQVVGAGYAVSEPVGNTAVIVKLFRIFLLLPVVLAIGWIFIRIDGRAGRARVPAPTFAVAFLILCLVNSAMNASPALAAAVAYPTIKFWLGQASQWGLLIAIAALGLGTSLGAILRIGWRHLAVFLGATVTVLTIVVAGLLLLR
jgi:uncharacterized integral membrane protein (TIGR00698 family)